MLARMVLIVLFSSIANTNTVAGPQLNLLLLTLSSSTLIGLSTTLKPYKTRLLNGLELFYLVLLLIFSTSNLYISSFGAGDESRANIYNIVLVMICSLVFFGICVGHIWYRVKNVQCGRRPELPQDRQEEEWYPVWWRARATRAKDEDEDRVDNNNKREVMVSTAGINENTVFDGGRALEYRVRSGAGHL